MTLVPIQKARVRINEPLALAIFDSEGHLLLARGRVVPDAEYLERLYERGACVRGEELEELSRAPAPAGPAPETPSDVLARLRVRLKGLLLEPLTSPDFKQALTKAGHELAALADRMPDRVLFSVMREHRDEHASYSLTHAIQCAVASHLVSKRLGWQQDGRGSTVLAALTMNLAMTRLQGELAAQATPPTPEQQQAIQKHPELAVEMLRQLGVQDEVWLRAVHEHHETPDASGYPRAIRSEFEPAELLRHIDVFMARAKSRVTRKAIYPNEAMREIFLTNGRNHVAAAVIKEFGLYPPGTFVRLASGTTAVVIARGEAANKPTVAEVLNRHGESHSPIRRDTGKAEFTVTAVVDAGSVRVTVDAEELYA